MPAILPHRFARSFARDTVNAMRPILTSAARNKHGEAERGREGDLREPHGALSGNTGEERPKIQGGHSRLTGHRDIRPGKRILPGSDGGTYEPEGFAEIFG